MASRSLGSLTIDVIAKIGGFVQGMSKAERAARDGTNKINRNMRSMETAMKNVSGQIRNHLVGIFAGIGVAKFSKSVVAATVELQKIQYTMQQAFGSGSAKEIDFIRKTADDLGLSFKGAAEGFAQLGASAKGTGVNAQQLETFFTGMSQAAAVLHSSTEDVNGVLTQLSQGLSLGKLQMQDFRAIAQHLPGTMVLVSKALKNMGTNLDDALKGGGVKNVAQFIEELGDVMQETFGEQAKNASHSLNSELNRLKSTLFDLQTSSEGFESSFAEAIRGINEALSRPEIRSGMQALISGMGELAEGMAKVIGYVPAFTKFISEEIAARAHGPAIGDSVRIDDRIKRLKETMEAVRALQDKGVFGVPEALNASELIPSDFISRPKTVLDRLQKELDKEQNKLKITASLKLDTADLPKIAETVSKNPIITRAPTAKEIAAAKALREAWERLYETQQKITDSANPADKAYNDFARTVANISKLGGDVIQKGGDVIRVQNAVADAVAAARVKLNKDLAAPMVAAKEFSDTLNKQLQDRQRTIAAQVAAIGMGAQEASNQQELARAYQDATDALAEFQRQHELHPEAMTEEQYRAELEALKKHNEDMINATKEGQKQIADAQADWRNGVNKAIDDFLEQQRNVAAQAEQTTTTIIDGFGDAFASIVSGSESAKDAIGSLLDDLYKQALKFVANKAIQALLDSFGSNGSSGAAGGGGGGWAGLITNFAAAFGGGKASGGAVGSGMFYQVNERGPELLTVGSRDYLMMGNQSGHITPHSPATRGRSGGTIINVAVQPTSTRRTAEQVAVAIDQRQRIATARNG